MKNSLIVLCGPTAVGKTKVAIELARLYRAEILSADSRQIFENMTIGTAAPDPEERATVPHHFVAHRKITEYYSASAFEQDVLEFLRTYFKKNPVAILAGGSGLYINAVCQGIDQLPDPDASLRQTLKEELKIFGLDFLRKRLFDLDPDYFKMVDLNNPNRILRALEVCIQTGVPYSSLRTNKRKSRDFSIVKLGLELPREELVNRIHQRVNRMMADGLLEEVRTLEPYRSFNALNTVGYKELFNFLDGQTTLEHAVEKIKTNTRRYAKRQMTWFKKDPEIVWFHPENREGIRTYLTTVIPGLEFEN